MLRAPAQALVPIATDSELAFVRRLHNRLAQESIADVAPTPLEAVTAVPAQPLAAVVHHRGAASNDSSFRWKLVAGVVAGGGVCHGMECFRVSGTFGLASAGAGCGPQIVLTSPSKSSP